MITPVNNQCLIEVLDEYSGLAHMSQDGQKGIVRKISLSDVHLTASTGFRLFDDQAKQAEVFATIKGWIGKTVRYALYADADSSSWQEDGKTWVLVPWYRVLAVESDVSTTTDTKR